MKDCCCDFFGWPLGHQALYQLRIPPDRPD